MAQVIRLSVRTAGRDVLASATASLFRALRHTVKSTLAEVLETPETMSAAPVGKQGGLALPICGIFARPPRPAESVVNEVAQVIPVDFVYARQTLEDGVTDAAQAVRDRLGLLSAALLADYRQGGTCNNTDLVETPAEITNQYQQYFREQGESLTAMVVTLEFTVLEPLP